MFNWIDYLRIAKRLIADFPSDEAALRAAVSRSYYAAFNLAKAHLISQNRIPAFHPRNTHDTVWRMYSSSLSAQELRIGQAGYRLRNLRNIADYEMTFPNLLRNSFSIVQQSRQLIVALQAL